MTRRSPEYARWSVMVQRCHNPKYPGYEWYGARGIAVCDRWRYGEDGKTGCECLLEGILENRTAPTSKHSLDRVDDDGNYEPGNVKWSTWAEQHRNRRPREFWKNAARMAYFDEVHKRTRLWLAMGRLDD